MEATNLFMPTGSKYQNVTAGELENVLREQKVKSIRIIDVRTPEEFASGHLPGAILVNIMDGSFRRKIAVFDREYIYYLYCRSGYRSVSACNIMARLGFKKLFNLEKGIIGWKGKLDY